MATHGKYALAGWRRRAASNTAAFERKAAWQAALPTGRIPSTKGVAKNMPDPKVLIVSHNALSDTQNNGKTMTAFFGGWDRECLAQLFLTTDVPDFTICRRFFQLHDFDLAARALGQATVQGRVIDERTAKSAEHYKAQVKKSGWIGIIRRRITPGMRLLRDIMWLLGGYKTQRLMRFVDDFKPDVVFFQSSSGVFAFSLVKWLCRSRGIPLVMQTTDDYVTARFSLSPAYWIQLWALQRAYRWAVKNAHTVIAIGEKMAAEYRARFGGRYFVAMNSVAHGGLPTHVPKPGKVRLVYAGNLGLNRWKVLARVGACLKELSEQEAIEGTLEVYSLQEPADDVMFALNRPPFSVFGGALDSSGLKWTFGQADILLHVEAFDRTSRHTTRLSISTKVPEYLAAGRCVVAVGPADVASIQYLAENDLGVVMSDITAEAMKDGLRRVIQDEELRARYAKRGVAAAKKHHDASRTREGIRAIIVEAVAGRAQ